MIRISTPQIEGNFQAAKWLKIQALVEVDELALLLEEEFYPLSGAFPLESFPMKKEAFLMQYGNWIEGLKKGVIPSEEALRLFNATAWVPSREAVWLQKIPNDKYLVRPCAPFLQCQVHHMGYSSVDGKFRPMVLGQETIFWGLQFSFPQVYQDPKTGELREVEDSSMFEKVRRWSREHTVATPMIVEKKRINLPIRLGKRCFSWIHRHPQLIAKGISVMELAYAH